MEDFGKISKDITSFFSWIVMGGLAVLAYLVADGMHKTVWVCPGGHIYDHRPQGQSCPSKWDGWYFPSFTLQSPQIAPIDDMTLFLVAIGISLVIALMFHWSVRQRIEWLDTLTKRAPLVLMRTSYGSIEEAIQESEAIFKTLVTDPHLAIAQAMPSAIGFGDGGHLAEAAMQHHTFYDNQTSAFLARRRVARLWVEAALCLIDRRRSLHTAWDAAVEALDAHLTPNSMPRLAALARLLGLPWDVTSSRFAQDFDKAKSRGLNFWVQLTVFLPLLVALQDRNWASEVQIRVGKHVDDPANPGTKKKVEEVLRGEAALIVMRKYIASPTS